MADNPLSGTFDVPKIGSVPKAPVLVIGGLAVVFVGWRWWQASSGGGVEGAPTDPGFEDGGALPGVDGAIRPGGDYGGGQGAADDPPPGTDSYGFTGTTNAQWVQYAKAQLVQGDRWSDSDIAAALGRYITNQPLSSEDQDIVRAAIAVAGPPPVGGFVIRPGGDVPITVAPGGVKATAKDTTTIRLSWSAVSGAHEYRIYRSGVTQNVGASRDTSAEVGGLQPGESYSFTVAAVTAAGKAGPRSAAAKATTKKVSLRAPSGLRVVKTTRTTAHLTWRTVPGADGYRMYHNRASNNVGASGDGQATVYGLKPNTSYSFHVRALDNHGTIGPASAKATGKTKK